MTRTRILLGVCVLGVALPSVTMAQRQVDPVEVAPIAEKLGVKLMPSAPRELELGRSTTSSLADPLKLVPYGIKGMHEGARVTITCVGPNRLRIEADELEPTEQRATVTVQIAADGSMASVADKPAPAKPPTP